jgi:hypothetical protein
MPKARKMLNDLEAPHVCALSNLKKTQSKATLVHWATGLLRMQSFAALSETLAERPAFGMRHRSGAKMAGGTYQAAEAKKLFLACHAAAREAYDNKAAQGAARAVGQSASTIHSTKHCMGLALYGAPAIAYDILGNDAAWVDIERYSAKVCRHMEVSLRAYAETHKPESIR